MNLSVVRAVEGGREGSLDEEFGDVFAGFVKR
jgi:hypothetical protein